MAKPSPNLLSNFGNALGSIVGNTIEKSANLVINASKFLNNEEAIKAALEDKEAYNEKLKEIKTIREANGTINQPEIRSVKWSFDNVPNTDDVNKNKLMMNALSSAKIMEDIKANKAIETNTPPVIADDTNPVIINLQKKIKCIECSIKKLELNLKLTNEDGINDGELLTLLQEISELCSKKDGVGCDENSELQEFVDEVILKRDMNSISGLIKLASFMCPVLAFANKSLVSNLGEIPIIDENEAIKKAAGICCKIVGYVAETGSDYDGTGELIESFTDAVGFIGASHEAGVIEGVVSFVGIGKNEVSLEKQIKGSIRSVVRTTIKNTINKVFKTATKYQQFICMVFITLLSTHILLTMSINGDKDATESYYSSFIKNAYNTTMSIGNGTMTGGKKASKSRRAAKPRAKRAAKAVSKVIAKVAAAKPKPVAKATANATKPAKPAKSAPKKKK
jgi:hypothetical protein